MNARTAHRPSAERLRQRPDPHVLRLVRQLALAGVALVLVWPAARGHHAWLGWAPLWLVGMPLVAWWALLGCPLPLRAALRRLRGPQQQARRRPARRPRRARGQAATA